MSFLRKHWYDLGGVFALILAVYLAFAYRSMSNYQMLMWVSLISLFIHQLEEYRIVGSFPAMINKVMFHSDLPDRYPLNPQTALIINVLVGWLVYLLAAVFAEKAIYLGIAAILISLGNTIAHTFVFNIKANTFYNAGMASSILLFLPISIIFFYMLIVQNIAQPIDYIIGIPLGIVLNVVGVLQLIIWLKDKKTPYIFPDRNLL